MSRSRAALGRELSSAVREFQGTARVLWRKEKTPPWWPAEIPFLSTRTLTVEQMESALRGFHALQQSARDEEASATSKTDVCLQSNRGALENEPAAMASKMDLSPAKGEVNKESVYLACARTPKKVSDDDITQGREYNDSTITGDERDKPCHETMQPTEPVISLKHQSDPDLSQSNILTERSQNISQHGNETRRSRPPRPHAKAKATGASKAKRKMMAEAAVEEAERLTQHAIEELCIDVEQRKQRLRAALRLKCDDMRSFAKLTLQKMSKEIRVMTIEEYIFKYGGEEQNVMIRDIEERVKSHMLLSSNMHDDGWVDASAEQPDETLDESETPSRKPERRIRTRRAAAIAAATTTRKMVAPTAAPPYTMRRSRRANPDKASAELNDDRPGTQLPPRVATRSSTLTKAQTPLRGISKIPSRKSRGSDALLGFAGGTPANSTRVTHGVRNSGLSVTRVEDGEDDDEATLLQKVEAAAAETERARRIEQELRRRLALTQRKQLTRRRRVR